MGVSFSFCLTTDYWRIQIPRMRFFVAFILGLVFIESVSAGPWASFRRLFKRGGQSGKRPPFKRSGVAKAENKALVSTEKIISKKTALVEEGFTYKPTKTQQRYNEKWNGLELGIMVGVMVSHQNKGITYGPKETPLAITVDGLRGMGGEEVKEKGGEAFEYKSTSDHRKGFFECPIGGVKAGKIFCDLKQKCAGGNKLLVSRLKDKHTAEKGGVAVLETKLYTGPLSGVRAKLKRYFPSRGRAMILFCVGDGPGAYIKEIKEEIKEKEKVVDIIKNIYYYNLPGGLVIKFNGELLPVDADDSTDSGFSPEENGPTKEDLKELYATEDGISAESPPPAYTPGQWPPPGWRRQH